VHASRAASTGYERKMQKSRPGASTLSRRPPREPLDFGHQHRRRRVRRAGVSGRGRRGRRGCRAARVRVRGRLFCAGGGGRCGSTGLAGPTARRGAACGRSAAAAAFARALARRARCPARRRARRSRRLGGLALLRALRAHQGLRCGCCRRRLFLPLETVVLSLGRAHLAVARARPVSSRQRPEVASKAPPARGVLFSNWELEPPCYVAPPGCGGGAWRAR